MRLDLSMIRPIFCLALLGLTACGGGGGTPAPPASPAAPSFALQVSPASLQIPAGGSGFVTVTVSRLNGFKGDIALAGLGFPAGASASGLLPEGTATLQLPVVVGSSVAPNAFPNLRIEGRSGGLIQTATFSLTVQAMLPPAQGTAELVQAAGARQQGGTLENQAVAQEPIHAVSATGSAGAVQVRHGFLPAGSSLKP